MDAALATPFTGIFISLVVYLIGMWLFKVSKGFFLFTPLLVGMVLGIVILVLWGKGIGSTTVAVYKKYYSPGGNMIFWFLNPATVAFAIPLYRRNDIFKKYWVDVFLTLFVGGFISLFGIHMVSKLMGLSRVSIAAMLPQAATTAIAMPIAKGIGGDPAITAMVCIINAVIIYALAEFLIKIFKLKNISKVGTGLGLGVSGHTVGSAKAVQLGSIEGAMASVAVVIVSLAMDILVPIYVNLFM
ncbi:LrgB family protein [Pediococcus acidilactici]|uniref:LrgB family protein n=1 Tax=Pediococcus acidilactici TaxID=1254 RepID=UPI0019527F62|nr:LrgB family protein [Pediococcus acidilactici]MBM6602970.1 LrgB family protein [Pediococcus acidilactici]MBM6643173.1 LrgB family protein [Pediococcus acidilactici]